MEGPWLGLNEGIDGACQAQGLVQAYGEFPASFSSSSLTNAPRPHRNVYILVLIRCRLLLVVIWEHAYVAGALLYMLYTHIQSLTSASIFSL